GRRELRDCGLDRQSGHPNDVQGARLRRCADSGTSLPEPPEPEDDRRIAGRGYAPFRPAGRAGGEGEAAGYAGDIPADRRGGEGEEGRQEVREADQQGKSAGVRRTPWTPGT